MKTLYYIITAALLFLAAGCTKLDEKDFSDAPSRDIFVKFENAGADTRAVEDPKANGDKVTFVDGYLFFVTGQKQIKRCFRLSAEKGGDPTNLDVNVINMKDFWDDAAGTKGYRFTNVPGDVKHIYMIGNLPDRLDAGTTTESVIRSKTLLSELKKVAVPLAKQSAINTVTIDGLGDITDKTGGKENEKEVTVNLSPLCSRIEMKQLQGAGHVTAYSLKGVYVSNFYKEMPLDNGFTDAAQILADLSDGSAYLTTWGMMYDAYATPLSAANKIVAPTPAGKVWSYQFFPGADKAMPAPNPAPVSPRIIVAITGITVSAGGGTFDSSVTYYLNIRGFKADDSGEGVGSMALYRGKVYRMETILFDEGDLSDIANPADISLDVKVTVEPWSIEVVKPVL